MPKKVETSLLEIAYEELGDANASPVILMHGFPNDVRAWNAVTNDLAEKGFRTLAIHTRGYGETRFLDKDTMRSGEGTAYTEDVIKFADVLELEKFTFVGHDWGAIAAYQLGILHAERLSGIVAASVGYKDSLPDAAARQISIPQIRAFWYRWLFNTDKGPETLAARRDELCRDMWRVWSPDWNFTDAEFQATANSWNNPDFQEIIIHSYRFVYKMLLGTRTTKISSRNLRANRKLASRPFVCTAQTIK